MANLLEKALESEGMEFSRSGKMLVLHDLPAKVAVEGLSTRQGHFVVGDVEPGTTVTETGTITLDGKNYPVHRCEDEESNRGAKPPKVGEGPGNLGRRGDWFQKRSN